MLSKSETVPPQAATGPLEKGSCLVGPGGRIVNTRRCADGLMAFSFVILRQAALAAQTGGPSGLREQEPVADTDTGDILPEQIAFGAAWSPGHRCAPPEDDEKKKAPGVMSRDPSQPLPSMPVNHRHWPFFAPTSPSDPEPVRSCDRPFHRRPVPGDSRRSRLSRRRFSIGPADAAHPVPKVAPITLKLAFVERSGDKDRDTPLNAGAHACV